MPPGALEGESLYVHNEIARLIGHSQSQVNMMNSEGALVGPFPPMLRFPQFGVPALSFIRTLDTHATLDKRVREVAILTVGAAFNARFELYAHEIMAESFGFSPATIAALASGNHPQGLNESETVAHHIASALCTGRIVPDSLYREALALFGEEAVAELIFLIGSYTLIATVLNGFDVPSPNNY